MVEWTENLYESVEKEILAIALFFDQKPTKENRCNFALHAMWVESSVVGKGVKLAKDFMQSAEVGAQVWDMLAEFWAE
ncbi:hypothetical protein FCM35_KLT09680 [Carex littledalei]|uniref:Uncharacterized protein n=1 Tax=Carex littledalei TaxID=544730 RepID=A0A833RS16_9POAL|nr:hypothetical protein FCM35_KLT09680 [Carex littledalei]